MPRRNLTLDDDTALKAAGLIAASAAVATIVDLGDGLMEANILIDVTALEIASNNEIYDIVAQFSSDADFGTDTNIQDGATLTLAAAEVQRTDCNKDDIIGRYILPVSNEIAGTLYRYMRLYTIVAGTIATGINYKADLCLPTA